MDPMRIREGLMTAILLAGVASTFHQVEIPEVGMVEIAPGQANLITPTGHKALTRKNLDVRLKEILSVDEDEMRKVQLQEMLAA